MARRSFHHNNAASWSIGDMNPGAVYVPKVQRSLADMNHGLRYEDVLNALGGEMQINQLVNGMVRLATPRARAALLGNTRHRRLCAMQSNTTRLGPLSTLVPRRIPPKAPTTSTRTSRKSARKFNQRTAT